MSSGPEAIPTSAVIGRLWISDLVQLTKPGIVFMALVTTMLGFYLASAGVLDLPRMFLSLAAIGLVGGAGNALNMVVERGADARMNRTASRPLPAGRLLAGEAVVFALVLGSAGLLLLVLAVNALTALLALATFASYLFVYTPLKRITPLCTLVGAVPGALPPVLGWTAATGRAPAAAWALFCVLFFWQIPHFLPLAWLHREDYERGGFRMLSLGDEEGRRTAAASMIATVVLVAASLLPAAAGVVGGGYAAGAIVLGVLFGAAAAVFAVRRTPPLARLLFFASLAYLPMIAFLMVLDRVGSG